MDAFSAKTKIGPQCDAFRQRVWVEIGAFSQKKGLVLSNQPCNETGLFALFLPKDLGFCSLGTDEMEIVQTSR